MYSRTPASSPARLGEQAHAHAAAPGIASAGIATGSSNGFSSCRSVAWKVRTGTAAITFCAHLQRVARAAAPSARLRLRSDFPAQLSALTGTFTSQPTSCETPGARLSAMGFSRPRRRACRPSRASTFARTSIVERPIARVAHREAGAVARPARAPAAAGRRTASGPAWSGSSLWPVPNRPASPFATATMRKEVSESLSGTSTVALPCASSFTRAFQSSSVSNSSRAGLPPAAAARLARLAAVVALADHLHDAVAVSTSMPRRCIIVLEQLPALVGHQLQQALVHRGQRHFRSFGAGLPSAARVTSTVTLALSRTR